MLNKIKSRFWELDVIKGISIILVILFHIIFDLYYFAQININLNYWLISAIGRLSATLFILISGVSFSIFFNKLKNNKKILFNKLLLRSAKLLILAIIITIVTKLFCPEGTIYFGILHFLSVVPIIAYFLINYRISILFAALSFLLITPLVQSNNINFYYLLWLGLTPRDFFTLDYFPIIPWFGLYLMGIFTGNILYKQNNRTFYIKNISDKKYIKFLTFIGRYTLILYLVHQPIILALIYLIFKYS